MITFYELFGYDINISFNFTSLDDLFKVIAVPLSTKIVISEFDALLYDCIVDYQPIFKKLILYRTRELTSREEILINIIDTDVTDCTTCVFVPSCDTNNSDTSKPFYISLVLQGKFSIGLDRKQVRELIKYINSSKLEIQIPSFNAYYSNRYSRYVILGEDIVDIIRRKRINELCEHENNFRFRIREYMSYNIYYSNKYSRYVILKQDIFDIVRRNKRKIKDETNRKITIAETKKAKIK